MSIGYACLAMGVKDTDLKSCRQKYAGEDRLMQIIAHNLAALENMIDYNRNNGIRLFRISSDIIPFGSSPVNDMDWQNAFQTPLSRIGAKIREAGIRVSMHPGQYTIINSPIGDVASRAVLDLTYHTRFLDSLGVGTEHKIILHIGGVYGEKEMAAGRFVCGYERLEESVKRRLVLENDEKSYNICDVLKIARKVGAPVVFDNLHHAIHPCRQPGSEYDWICECKKTWRQQDGRQKIHYSQQAPGKKAGAHSDSIRIDEFLSFYEAVQGEDLDIMLEVKDKNLSAVKCINCTSDTRRQERLELDWSRYKYLILEKSPAIYQEIRQLLLIKQAYPTVSFYHLVESAMMEEATSGNAENAALHVWGYFKKYALENEKIQFFRRLDQYRNKKAGTALYKKYLLRLAHKYDQKYLLDSLYFYI